MALQAPTFADVLAARRRISAYVHRTPLRHYPGLSEITGAEVWVKHENYQILGAFKVRGGVNLVSQLAAEARAKGFVTASTGNHGQSIAFAARTFGSSATVVVPEGANPGKVAAMRALGAEVVFHGRVFEESRDFAERLQAERGLRYVHAANEPDLIAGVGTYSLEVFEDLGDVDALIVPLGAGSGASGASVVRDAVSPSTDVFAVQSERAPAGYRSWKAGELVDAPVETEAEGLATGSAYELPQSILRKSLADFFLVSEDAIRGSILAYLEHAHSLVEGAGAAALAGLIENRERFRGKRVVVIASGANLSMAHLRSMLGS